MLVKNKVVKLLLMTVLLVASRCVMAVDAVPRIIGGIISANHAYPFMVALEYDGSNFQFCGGTLITPTKVLTAGHCLVTDQGVHIRIGTNNKTTNPGQTIKVSSQARHPKYNPSTIDYDVAVFSLAAAVTLSDAKNLIKLPEACSNLQCITGLAKSGTIVRTAGWGSTATDGSAPSLDLREVDLPLLANETCSGSMVGITDRMICAGYDQGVKDSCFGDSGGPLFSYLASARTGLQTGIVSWGHTTCAQLHTYGVYTRISNPEIRKFIRDKAGV